uniref:DUF4230 domain-containing protein n=1 Tax=Candidatus Kentrum eta TaxID=2126337 RepID=A0A450US77_9GAMM|nr:MAG: Protein of unknown function (DUF4230) [Candidatus Kentron sp. H]VFJ95433.1 MAG: Protein of unknown function (DUF4230) [Candidatus Kentron sp. H]VFK01518.1 MAG: Protein of unknown function (DUF4230) [Candidatus Kentron sp. H]
MPHKNKFLSVILMIGMALFTGSTNAFCLFNCDEKVAKNLFSDIKSKGNEEQKLISYSVHKTIKTKVSKTAEQKEESFLGKATKWVDDALHSQEVEAVLVTKTQVGIDLHSFSENSVAVDGDNVKITLPPLEVISIELDHQNSMIANRKSGLLVDTKDNQEFLQDLMADHKSAIKKGVIGDPAIRTKAYDRLKEVLTGLVKQRMEDDNVTVMFIEST